MKTYTAGEVFYVGVDTGPDTSGIGAGIVTTIIELATGAVVANSENGIFIEAGSTGVYNAPIRLGVAGKYQINLFHVDYGNIAEQYEIVEVDSSNCATIADIEAKLQIMQDYLCQCSVDSSEVTNNKLDTIDSGLRQVLGNLGDEIDINEVKIENNAKTMTMII